MGKYRSEKTFRHFSRSVSISTYLFHFSPVLHSIMTPVIWFSLQMNWLGSTYTATLGWNRLTITFTNQKVFYTGINLMFFNDICNQMYIKGLDHKLFRRPLYCLSNIAFIISIFLVFSTLRIVILTLFVHLCWDFDDLTYFAFRFVTCCSLWFESMLFC